MLRLRYDSEKRARWRRAIAEAMRDAPTRLGRAGGERGAFPLFNADLYLSGRQFAVAPARGHQGQDPQARHPQLAPAVDRAHRHDLARVRRQRLERHRAAVLLDLHAQEAHADGTFKEYAVEDYAWRLYKHVGGDTTTAAVLRDRARDLRAGAQGHGRGGAPYVDTSISKTVNVPEDYPYADFEDLYLTAWKAGLKGLATYRPNSVLGAVLSVTPSTNEKAAQDVEDDANRRLRIKSLPEPVLSSLRWPGRPSCPTATWPGPTCSAPRRAVRAVRRPHRERRAAPLRGVGQRRRPAARPGRGRQDPVDGHARQRPRLAASSSSRPSPAPSASDAFDMPFPPHGEKKHVPRRGVRLRPGGALALREARRARGRRHAHAGARRRLFSLQEPKTGSDGTLSWTVDISNPATGEDFVLGLKEITLPDGVTRPYSVWLSGNYPRALDGLCRILSLDMRVIDPAWIGMKLRKLLNYPEPLGDFMAFVPGTKRQQNYPSTVAYMARLIIHRYAMLGVLDESAASKRRLEAREDRRRSSRR
jgi:ribonucleoside-diphosphate reductase alpha chain